MYYSLEGPRDTIVYYSMVRDPDHEIQVTSFENAHLPLSLSSVSTLKIDHILFQVLHQHEVNF